MHSCLYVYLNVCTDDDCLPKRACKIGIVAMCDDVL